jgi:hypothetical protein
MLSRLAPPSSDRRKLARILGIPGKTHGTHEMYRLIELHRRNLPANRRARAGYLRAVADHAVGSYPESLDRGDPTHRRFHRGAAYFVPIRATGRRGETALTSLLQCGLNEREARILGCRAQSLASVPSHFQRESPRRIDAIKAGIYLR